VTDVVDDEFVTEVWTYGGIRVTGAGRSLSARKRTHAWYDATKYELYFDDKSDRIVGGDYNVLCRREGDSMRRRGIPSFLRLHEDVKWRAELEIRDRAARTELARVTRERNAAKQSELERATVHLAEIAKGCRTQQEVDSLTVYVIRAIHRSYYGYDRH
jgi:hypothetical protein